MNRVVSHDSETPAHGQQVITACAFIHRKFDTVEKVFLPRRASTKKFLPNIFELPGGHINFGEDIVVGLQREIMEEFGVKASIGDPYYVFTYNNHIKGSHSIEVIYFGAFSDSITSIKIYPDNHSEYRWFSEDELRNSTILQDGRDKGDKEIEGILRGFEIIKGSMLKFD